MNLSGKIFRTMCSAVAALGLAAAIAEEPMGQGSADSGYRLSSQDAVHVLVFQEDDLSGPYRLSGQGQVSLPLAGQVALAGLTCEQAARAIENAFRPDYLLHPHVTVTVADFSKRRITVLGEVNKPGAYEVGANETLDLTEAIGLAGGYTRIANPARTTLKRTLGGREEVHQLNAKDMIKRADTDRFRVLPGDTITVGKSIF